MMENELFDLLSRVAFRFRLGMEGQASEDLVCFIDVLSKMMPKMSLAQDREFNHLLEAAYAAQMRKDYLFVADILEYRLKELLLRNLGQDAVGTG